MHLFHHLSKIKDLAKLGVRPVKSLWHIQKATQSDYIAPGLLSLLCTIVPLKVLPGGSVGKESACNAEDLGLIPGLGRSHGEGKSYPIQHSGLRILWTVWSMESQSVGCNWATCTSLHIPLKFTEVQFSCSVVSDSLQPHKLQHTRPPCPLPTPRVHSNSCPSSQWCHPAISSSVVPFSSCLQSLPASESFPMSQLFTWGGQSAEVSALASFLPKNTQGWSLE